jgi:hypothetical protein
MSQENSTQTESSQINFGPGSFLNQNKGDTNFYCFYNDFNGRPIDEVVRIQHQQFLLQSQYQNQNPQTQSSSQPASNPPSSSMIPSPKKAPVKPPAKRRTKKQIEEEEAKQD